MNAATLPEPVRASTHYTESRDRALLQLSSSITKTVHLLSIVVMLRSPPLELSSLVLNEPGRNPCSMKEGRRRSITQGISILSLDHPIVNFESRTLLEHIERGKGTRPTKLSP